MKVADDYLTGARGSEESNMRIPGGRGRGWVNE